MSCAPQSSSASITLTRYEVAFPGQQPTIQDIKFASEYTGVFPARVYSVVNERGRFLVTVVDYTNAALCPRTSAGTNVTLTRSQQFAKKTNFGALVSR